jgi:zinc transporter ZupT
MQELVVEKLVAMALILVAAGAGLATGFCLFHRVPEGTPTTILGVHKRCCSTRQDHGSRSWSSAAYLASGGVLTAAALVHLLADASETLRTQIPGFPLAEFLCGLGLLITMVIEAVGQTTSHTSFATTGFQPASSQDSGRNVLDTRLNSPRQASDGRKIPAGSPIVATASGISLAPVQSRESMHTDPGFASMERESALTTAAAGARVPDTAKSGGIASGGTRSADRGDRTPTKSRESDPSIDGGDEEASEALLHGMAMPVGRTVDWKVAVLVFCCLSFHSFVAGVALGLSSSGAEVTDVLVAIVAHKGLAATAMSTALLRARVSWSVFLRLCLTFSTVTPIGVALGLVAERLMDGTEDSPITAAVLAFASGTFLQVGLVEMIVHELHDAHSKSQPSSAGSITGLPRRRKGQANPCACSSICTLTVSGLGIAFTGFCFMSLLAVWV